MKKLNLDIVKALSNKLGLSEKTIKKDIYLLVKDYPNLTKNAVAQVYARKNNFSVFTKLDKDDRVSLPPMEANPDKIIVKTNKRIKKYEKPNLFEYETSDHFIKGHLKELNKANNSNCYTAVFILIRKVVENLIVDILRKKYPSDTELYYDKYQNRFKDFSVILDNLYKKRNDFVEEKKAAERLYNLAKPLKDNSNDKAHSWFHLVENDKEIDELNIKQIIGIIIKLEKTVGIR